MEIGVGSRDRQSVSRCNIVVSIEIDSICKTNPDATSGKGSSFNRLKTYIEIKVDSSGIDNILRSELLLELKAVASIGKGSIITRSNKVTARGKDGTIVEFKHR